jgi:hypothetical protein
VLAILSTILVLVLAVFAMNALWSWLIATTTNSAALWPSVSGLARGIGAGWLILGTFGLFGALLGILFRSTAMAVGLGLVWVLAVENLIRGFAGVLGFLDALQKGLPGTNAGSLVAALGAPTIDQTGGTPGVNAVVGGPQAAIVLLIYVSAIVAIAALALQRQDVR